ncbi:hypothetical protein Nepgr_010775 [Nepenthes gracilis]|uniref:Membrane-associated kinase regulator 6 n=1 Tax=Nepenthes gracilis TaxID=150966 RepID=A0AAD3SDW6_NEPGR|nr:hypothetical protein Nepgr_010775 [Nepenthes gracilis]
MAIAETSQPLSIDSFSHAWLINLKPSFESLGESFRAVLDESDEAFFIDMDPRMPPSKRFSRCAQDFDFDLPVSHQSSAAAILHADELFSNGLLKPLVDPSKVEACGASGSTPGSRALGKKALDSKMRSSSLRRCRSLSKKMLDKYMDFFKLLLHKIRGSKSRSRVRAVSSSINGVLSPGTSPRASVGSFAGDWRRSCDSESSIYEAVLHCKRSIGT